MRQEEKELLLKDLSARLHYGVKVTTTNPAAEFGVMSGISIKGKVSVSTKNADIVFECTEVKPYLRHISSITKEEKQELRNILWFGRCSDDYDDYGHKGICIVDIKYDDWKNYNFDFEDFEILQTWLNKHNIDYRGLIEKGLAIEITSENNPYK